MVATIGRDQFAALGLIRVLPVVKPLFQGLRDGFALADFMLLIVSRGRRQPSFMIENSQTCFVPSNMIKYYGNCFLIWGDKLGK